jgi:hypothetical protein
MFLKMNGNHLEQKIKKLELKSSEKENNQVKQKLQ